MEPSRFGNERGAHNLVIALGLAVEQVRPLAKNIIMFKAIGLILIFIAVRFLMPPVFNGLEDTLVQFFGVLQSVLAQGQNTMQGASVLMAP